MKKLSDAELSDQLRDLVVAFLRNLPKERRCEQAAFLMALSYELVRGIAGNAFVLGWLERAIQDVKTDPPKVVIREFDA